MPFPDPKAAVGQGSIVDGLHFRHAAHKSSAGAIVVILTNRDSPAATEMNDVIHAILPRAPTSVKTQ